MLQGSFRAVNIFNGKKNCADLNLKINQFILIIIKWHIFCLLFSRMSCCSLWNLYLFTCRLPYVLVHSETPDQTHTMNWKVKLIWFHTSFKICLKKHWFILFHDLQHLRWHRLNKTWQLITVIFVHLQLKTGIRGWQE